MSVYFTAGFPALNDTRRIIKALDKYGADMIEIGMPFSDPVADGPVIQKSSKKALNNGMNLALLFEQLSDLRQITDIPVILMGYLNPVFRMGMEKFLNFCYDVGIDGVILPDFPLEEYENTYKKTFNQYGIYNVLLITPQSSENRIRKIDEISKGFVYMVSSYSTTGVKEAFGDQQILYFERIKRMQLSNPTLVGFGISSKESYQTACRYSNGAIIGTAFIKAIEKNGKLDEKVKGFIRSLR